jgi:hypothetical protein
VVVVARHRERAAPRRRRECRGRALQPRDAARARHEVARQRDEVGLHLCAPRGRLLEHREPRPPPGVHVGDVQDRRAVEHAGKVRDPQLEHLAP